MLLMTITAALLHLMSQQYDSCILRTSCRQYTWWEGQVGAVPHAGNIPGGRGRWEPYLMQVIYLVGGAGGSRTLCSCNIPGGRGRWEPYLMQL